MTNDNRRNTNAKITLGFEEKNVRKITLENYFIKKILFVKNLSFISVNMHFWYKFSCFLYKMQVIP